MLALTLTGCGGSSPPPVVPEPISTIDWMMPVEALGTFEVAFSHFNDAAPTNPERSYTVDGISFHLPRPNSPGAKQRDYSGATWKGDALGMVKASAKPVSGPAVLTLTSIEQAADGIHAYSLDLEAAFRNVGVDRAELSAASNTDGGFGVDLSDDGGYRVQGVFLGSQAQEASWIFETAIYYGAFGVKRSSS